MRDEEERQDLRVRTKDFALRIIRMYSALSKTEVSSVVHQHRQATPQSPLFIIHPSSLIPHPSS